jgi:hypothetical protein
MTLSYYKPTREFCITSEGSITLSDGKAMPGPLAAVRCIVDATADQFEVPQLLRRLADEIEHIGHV